MERKLVSATITTHGRLELLKKAIQSVRVQTYPNIELIVVDDCSEDGTKNWAEQEKSFEYIYIPKSESKGGNYARNQGIIHSTGEYIAFLDDDDTWEERKIEKQIDLIESNEKLGFVYCGYSLCNENGNIVKIVPDSQYRGDVSKKSLTYILCTTSSLVVKRKILDQVGLFDENLKFWQETELIIRLAQISETDFIPEPLMNYLQVQAKSDPERLSGKFDQWLEAVEYINNKHKDLIQNLDEDEKKERQLLIYGDAANRCLMSGQMRKRRDYKKRIFKLEPSIKNFVAYFFGIDKQILRLKTKKL